MVFTLADNANEYLLSIGNSGNSNSTLASLGLAAKVLELVISTGRYQLNGVPNVAADLSGTDDSAPVQENKHSERATKRW